MYVACSCVQVTVDATLEKIWRTLVNEPYVVVVNKQKECKFSGTILAATALFSFCVFKILFIYN